MAGFAATLEDLARALQQGMAKAAVQFTGSQKTFTIDASADTFTSVAHGYSAGDVVVLNGITTTTGISTYTRYYVIASGLTADVFKLSATSGGSAIDMTTNGSATGYRAREGRVRMANTASGQPEVKTINYEGDNIIIPVRIMQSITFDLDSDAIPIGTHAALFGLSEVTANLPDSYTSAYGLFGTAGEQTGKTIGFWFETQDTYWDNSGVQSTKTVRYWMPSCTLTPNRPPGGKTADKPDAWRYSVSVTDFAPTVDVAGVALPVTGAPVIRMMK